MVGTPFLHAAAVAVTSPSLGGDLSWGTGAVAVAYLQGALRGGIDLDSEQLAP